MSRERVVRTKKEIKVVVPFMPIYSAIKGG